MAQGLPDPQPKFLDDKRYNGNQIRFVEMVIDYLTDHAPSKLVASTTHPSPPSPPKDPNPSS